MEYDIWQTCMLLPVNLNRGECASWVQAWGSIGAIVGAFSLAQWNEHRALRSRREVAVRKARSFAASMGAVADTVIAIAPHNNFKEIRTVLALADELMLDARTIEQELLELKWTNAVFGLRSVGAQMAEFLRLVQPKDLTGNWAEGTVRRFKEHLERIEVDTAVVRDQHPGLPIKY